jgi:subtilisin-like proprotein convertase family protein
MCRKISLAVAVDATHSKRDDSGRKLISPNLEEMLSQRKKGQQVIIQHQHMDLLKIILI